MRLCAAGVPGALGPLVLRAHLRAVWAAARGRERLSEGASGPAPPGALAAAAPQVSHPQQRRLRLPKYWWPPSLPFLAAAQHVIWASHTTSRPQAAWAEPCTACCTPLRSRLPAPTGHCSGPTLPAETATLPVFKLQWICEMGGFHSQDMGNIYRKVLLLKFTFWQLNGITIC